MNEIYILKKWIDAFKKQYNINPTFEQVDAKILEIIKLEKKKKKQMVNQQFLKKFQNIPN